MNLRLVQIPYCLLLAIGIAFASLVAARRRRAIPAAADRNVHRPSQRRLESVWRCVRPSGISWRRDNFSGGRAGFELQ
jgi:hypothetical protein